MNAVFVCVAVALLVGLASSQTANPIGKWTDSRYPTSGGFFFICKKTTYVTVYTGVYSQIGYVKGKFAKNIFSGRWYEPGLGRDVDGQFLPTAGNFWLNFTSPTSFSGYYTYDEDATETQHAWSGAQLNTNKPDALKCWDNTNAMPIIRTHGVWDFLGSNLVLSSGTEVGEQLRFNASHFYQIPGYFEGYCNDTDQICRGQFLQEAYYGQVLFGIGQANSLPLLYITIYAGTWEDIKMNIGLQYKDPAQHIYTSAPQVSASADEAEAAEYQVILMQGNFENTAGVSFNPSENYDDVNSTFLAAATNVGVGQNTYSYYRDYAVLRGSYDWSSRTLTGVYFAPGLHFSDNSPTYGTYTLSVSWDWLSVTGTFTPAAGEDVVYDTGDWTFDRVYWLRVSDDESLYNWAGEQNITGNYLVDIAPVEWIVCVDSESGWLNGSIVINNTDFDYTSAYCSIEWQVCSGVTTQGDRKGGYTFAFRTDTGVQVDRFTSRDSLPNETVKTTASVTKQAGTPSEEDCWATNYLVLLGTWDDSVYGEKLYINYLETPTTLFGAYSEVGVLRGQYSAETRRWVGRWAEAGKDYGSPTALPSGPVTISWSDVFSFAAEFRFDQRITSNPDVVVYESYINSEPPPTTTQAWSNDAVPSVSVSGVYGDSTVPDVFYLCLNDSSIFPAFFASYNWPDGTKGYVEGTCDLINDVCRGSYYQNQGSLYGQAIYTIINQGDTLGAPAFLASHFNGPWSGQMVSSQFNDPTKHVVATYTRESFAASASACSSNSALKPDTDTGSDTSTDTSTDTSDSWSMKVNGVLMMVMMVVVVMFM